MFHRSSAYRGVTAGLKYILKPNGALLLERYEGLGASKGILPIVAVTNNHKSFGSKQHVFVTLQFWKSEVPSEFPWAKIIVSAVFLSF